MPTDLPIRGKRQTGCRLGDLKHPSRVNRRLTVWEEAKELLVDLACLRRIGKDGIHHLRIAQYVNLRPTILKALVGAFELAPGRELKLIERDGQLVALAPNVPDLPLVAESESKFANMEGNVVFEFVKNAAGAVEEVIFRVGPNTRRLKPIPPKQDPKPQ